ncbi:MAG: hypothetical protein IIB83_01585 [Bacteroidetes bacterium]|nr:hypothetical protein [Bacteroidota bacterium]
MFVKLIKIFVLLTILFSGCTEDNKTELPLAKNIFNTKKEQIKEFYFVGKDGNKLGIFKHDFAKRKSIKFWFDRKEKVILLNYSPNLKHIYFLTAKYYGIRSTLPYIKRIKLYSIDLYNNEVNFIDSLMNGTQINADWINDNSFKVIINSRDLRFSEYMNKHTFIYNNTGKKLLSTIETINFIKEGYPLPVINRFPISVKKNNQLVYGDSLYIFDKIENEKHFVLFSKNLNIHKEYWSDEFLIFNTVPNEKRNILLIYSIKRNQVIKIFENNNIKNFILFNDYLVYDYGLDFSSSISIFNIKKSELADSIKIKGGCGLKSIL